MKTLIDKIHQDISFPNYKIWSLIFDEQFLSLTKLQVSHQKELGLFTYLVTAAE